MTSTATLAPLVTADLGDELAAGMPFPVRDALVRISPASAVALIRARFEFWTAAAAGYDRLVSLGCSDSEWDRDQALAQAARYTA